MMFYLSKYILLMVQIKERIDKNIFSQVLREFYFVDELVQFLDTPE